MPASPAFFIKTTEKGIGVMAQPRTLGWLISTLKWYEDLRKKNSSSVHPSGGIIAVLADSAEAMARQDVHRDLLRVSSDIAGAAGNGRIELLCDEINNNDGLTAANVVKLRVKVCRTVLCSIEEANVLTLDQVAEVLEPLGHSLVERLLTGPDEVELAAHDLAFLEAYLKQPVSSATIQQEQKATSQAPTSAVRNKLTAIRDFNRNLQLAKEADGPKKLSESTSAIESTNSTRKCSTVPGEGRVKIIAALTKHHQYADGGCLNLEPIGNNELAKVAGVSTSTASGFFKTEFEGYAKYRTVCRDSGRLVDSLKALNGEFSPHELYGRRPAGEDDCDDDD